MDDITESRYGWESGMNAFGEWTRETQPDLLGRVGADGDFRRYKEARIAFRLYGEQG